MKRNLFSFPRSQMVGKKLRAMSLIVTLFWATTAMADIVVKGVVSDDAGVPIPGANVTELNSKGNGTITNIDGEYSIVVKNSRSVLRFSFIGYTNIVLLNQIARTQSRFDTQGFHAVCNPCRLQLKQRLIGIKLVITLRVGQNNYRERFRI